MAGNKLKLFQTVQNLYQDVGICPPQSNAVCAPNAKNLFILSSLLQFFATTSAFFLFKAKSMQEYAISLFVVLSEFGITIFILIIAQKMSIMLQFIDGMEQFIAKSKRNWNCLLICDWRFHSFCKCRIGSFTNIQRFVHEIKWSDWTRMWTVRCHYN